MEEEHERVPHTRLLLTNVAEHHTGVEVKPLNSGAWAAENSVLVPLTGMKKEKAEEHLQRDDAKTVTQRFLLL